jgi:hypothetical protein
VDLYFCVDGVCEISGQWLVLSGQPHLTAH